MVEGEGEGKADETGGRKEGRNGEWKKEGGRRDGYLVPKNVCGQTTFRGRREDSTIRDEHQEGLTNEQLRFLCHRKNNFRDVRKSLDL
jgi:hypothetical protein